MWTAEVTLPIADTRCAVLERFLSERRWGGVGGYSRPRTSSNVCLGLVFEKGGFLD